MLNKIPIRLRLTAISVLLLTVCCIGLTVVLNFSASRMADAIEAAPILPATETGGHAAPPAAIITPSPSQGSQAAREYFQSQSIIYMLLIIAVGGAITYYMTGKALVPLQELSGQMKNRTVYNLAEKLPMPKSHDEISDLTASFNQMSQTLDEAFAMQKRFSQNAAHELRTPLAVLRTKVDVFKKKEKHTPDEYDNLLAVITAHTDRLSALVVDLLELTNADALACDEQIELDSLLLEISEELEPLAEENQISIAVEGAETQVVGNRSLLHRAFYNLIENSIKYNIKNGRVTIRVSGEGGRAQVAISDTGIGIPSEYNRLIFEPFYRVDKSRSRQMGGAGLGLAIVKSIIDKHGGSIEVAPCTGGGTSFHITL